MSVKLLACAAVLVCALVLGATSALASGGGSLKAEDFELRPPAGAVHAAAGGGVASKPLAAPKRFNLVGMRWRGRAEPTIRVRVRPRGVRWTRWQMLGTTAEHNPDAGSGEPQVAASDPVWAGDADVVQYRMDRRVPGLRLHFVRITGHAAAPARGLRARSSQLGPPAMVTRAQWGASQCPPRTGPTYGVVKAVHVHHTVSLNEYLPTDGPAMVLAICRYHRNSLGWNDIGYNALIDKYGVLYEGRSGGIENAVMGAQAEGYNAQTAGIASIGDHTAFALPQPALAALSGFIGWKLAHHGVPTFGTTTLVSTGGGSNRFPSGRSLTVPVVLGHRDTNATACPGNLLYAQLDQLRAMVAGGVGPVAGSGPQLLLELSATNADYRAEVPVAGILAAGDGFRLPWQPVTLETMSEGVWTTARQLVTGPTGEIATTLVPRKRMYVRLRSAGAADPRLPIAPAILRPVSSPRMLLRVRPKVAARSSRRGVRGRKVRVKGSVTPRKRMVRLVLQQRMRGTWRRVGARRVRTQRGGIFESSFTPESSARYRFYVVADLDADTDRARSDLRVVRVSR